MVKSTNPRIWRDAIVTIESRFANPKRQLCVMRSPSRSLKSASEGEEDKVTDQPLKKTRSETANEVVSTGNNIKSSIATPTVEADVSPVDEVLCAICMGSDGTELKLLKTHSCPVCIVGAWNICDVCDDNLLSRSCPVCMSDYSPRILHVTQGLPTFPVSRESMSDTEFVRKICAIGKLVTGSNVTVWCPVEELMHFFLPQEFTDNNADFRSLSVVIPMTKDKIVDGQFMFTNKVWDELLKEMEEGPNNSDEILTSKDTMKRIFTALNSSGSKLLTQLRPDEWKIFEST